jgi:hypothetical protein
LPFSYTVQLQCTQVLNDVRAGGGQEGTQGQVVQYPAPGVWVDAFGQQGHVCGKQGFHCVFVFSFFRRVQRRLAMLTRHMQHIIYRHVCL